MERPKILLTVVLLFNGLSCTDFGTQVPFIVQETSMGCIDKVSIGGLWTEVINSKGEYEDLIYRRFQRPLDTWFNASYASLLETVRRRYPGLADSQYVQLAKQEAYNYYPFRGTENCKQPSIDFSRYTLLGQGCSAGGCTPPDYLTEVTRNDGLKKVIFKVRIVQHGSCEIGWSKNKWILIPKVYGDYSISFEKELVRE